MKQETGQIEAPPAQKRGRTASALIFLIVFLDLLGVGLIVPLSPYIVGRFDASAKAVAMLSVSFSAAQFLATPVLGMLSDRFGRRPVLLGSLFGTAVSYVAFALAGSLPMLFAARAVAGAAGGSISTAQAYIADMTAPENRAKAYGLVGAAFGLGFTLGPAISGALTTISLMTPVWAAAGLALVTMVLTFVALPETLTPEKRSAAKFKAMDLNPVRSLLAVTRLPAVGGLIGAVFMFGFSHAELRAAFGVLLRDKLSYTEQTASWMFAYMGLLAVLVQGGLVRKLTPRLGDRRTALIGLPLAALGYAVMPIGSTTFAVGAALTILAIGGGLAQPTITSMLSGRADPSQQGAVLGASQSAAALALVIGQLFAGWLYDELGWGWPFWTGAGFVLGAMVLVAASSERRPATAASGTA